MGNSFVMLCGSGLILMIIGLLFHKPILYLFGASDETFPYAQQYIVIYLLGSVFVMISLGMNGFINSQGFSQIGMMTVILGAVTNIVLDPVFIFRFHMGVRGAALATILSQMLSAVWVIRFLTGPRAILKLRFRSMKLEVRRAERIMGLGLSGFVMAVTNSLTQIACNSSLSLHGGDLYVGVMTVLNAVREIITMPVQGITNGATPVMSFNYGAGEYKKVRQAIRFVTLCSIVYTVAVWGLLLTFPAFFIKIFNDDAQLVEAGIPAMKIYFFGIFMMSLQFAGQNVFVSLGKAKQAVFFSLFRKVIIVVPLTYLLPHVWGVDGVFLAEPISNFVGGIACYTTMLLTVYPELLGKKREKKT